MTSAAARLRPFEPGDRPRLQEIRAAAFAPVFASFRSLLGPDVSAIALASAETEQAALLDRLAEPGSAAELHVMEEGGTVIGFISWTIDAAAGVGEIGLNAVDPAHAGKGAGTAMYRFAVDRMRTAGMKVASVGTGGDASHEPARRAYEKAGFGQGIPSIYLYKKL